MENIGNWKFEFINLKKPSFIGNWKFGFRNFIYIVRAQSRTVKYITIISFFIFCLIAPVKTHASEIENSKSAAITKAFAYLKTQQQPDGGFGSLSQNDWVILALAAHNYDYKTLLEDNHTIDDYQLTATDQENLQTSAGLSRHLLAMIAAGQNTDNPIFDQYHSALINFYDETQCDNPTFLNDDIFAALALMANNDPSDGTNIEKSIMTLIKNQNSDGGFSWVIPGPSDSNITAVAIQALSYFKDNFSSEISLKNTLLNARQYLKSIQNTDSGFGYFGASDADSTAWVMQAILALGENPEDWVINERTPTNYLLSLQNTDGSFFWQADTYPNLTTTIDVLLALSGKPLPTFTSTNPIPFPQDETVTKNEPTTEPIPTTTNTTTPTNSTTETQIAIQTITSTTTNTQTKTKKVYTAVYTTTPTNETVDSTDRSESTNLSSATQASEPVSPKNDPKVLSEQTSKPQPKPKRLYLILGFISLAILLSLCVKSFQTKGEKKN